MRLIRGWENRYSPDATGGLRLSRARLYREIGEEDGLGDLREGEIRVRTPPGQVTVTWEDLGFPIRLSPESQEQSDAEMSRLIREEWGERMDDPNIEVEQRGPDHWKVWQNLKIDDSELGSPYLLCLSREPGSRTQWERLREALPERFDTWTITEDLSKLKFEIECGIKRWLALNSISKHQFMSQWGWVEYTYDDAPPNVDAEETGYMTRWFRKGRRYQDQQEYRIAWDFRSPQMETFPNYIDIELTRTGLSLFQPWTPPER